ncbi:MAG: HAD hydrolase-like protein [Alphaproteobacteria bacterium]|nr:HAD hydrolase-like protein [Alphaproteobacteria bacterium]
MNKDTFEQYDIFLVDAYGVFWDGKDFIPGAKERFESLVKSGKEVIILSNTTQLSEPAIRKYESRGLLKGKHYNELITSGEVTRHVLEKSLSFNNKHVHKYYTFGTPNHALFKDLDYSSVDNLKDADFVYISIPQFENKIENFPMFKSVNGFWDTTDIKAFKDQIDKILESKLPILNANPDLGAPESNQETGQINFVIRQGSIANYLLEKGAQVKQIGKPYLEVYQFCIDLLKEKYSTEEFKSKRIVMVGDTPGTDILGAQESSKKLGMQINSILTLTGNATNGFDFKEGEEALNAHLKKQFDTVSAIPTHIIKSFGLEK